MFHQEQLLTVKEACRLLRVSRSFIYQQHRMGNLPFVKLGSLTRIRAADLESITEAGLVEGRCLQPVRTGPTPVPSPKRSKGVTR